MPPRFALTLTLELDEHLREVGVSRGFLHQRDSGTAREYVIRVLPTKYPRLDPHGIWFPLGIGRETLSLTVPCFFIWSVPFEFRDKTKSRVLNFRYILNLRYILTTFLNLYRRVTSSIELNSYLNTGAVDAKCFKDIPACGLKQNSSPCFVAP